MKSIGSQLFSATLSKHRASPVATFQRVSARDLALQESWFRDAIFDNPELIIAPCREAGRVNSDEVWLPWRTEINFGSGPVDVLLVSSYGRVGIIETKLSYNPQKRREVVAQVLDYALSLQEAERDDLPALPDSEFAPDEADLAESLAAGRFLLVIAGDALDPRAVRLSQSLLARHLTSEWDLAMIDLNVFQSTGDADNLLIVPELLGSVVSEIRQVVRVKIEGDSSRSRVVVEHVSQEASPSQRAQKLASIEEFFEHVETTAPARSKAVRTMVAAFRQAATENSNTLQFMLQTNSANLYWITPQGQSRRVLTIKIDGRFRLIFRYISAHPSLVQRLLSVSRPVINIAPSERNGTIFLDQKNADTILSLVQQVAAILIDERHQNVDVHVT